MNRNLILKISLIANAGLVGLMALVAARPISSYVWAMNPSFSKQGDVHARRGLQHFCNEQDREHLDTLSAFVEAKLELTSEQADALDQLTTVLETSAIQSFEPLCADLSAEALSAPEQLDRLQTVLSVSSETIAQVRPSFDSFYNSLDEAQRQELESLLSRHRPPSDN